MIHGEGPGPAANKETVRSHRWRFELQALKDFVIYALSCQRPSYESDTVIMHNGINQIHLPAKIKWNPINVVFYDIIEGVGSLTARKIFEYWSGFNTLVGGGQSGPINLMRNIVNPRYRATADIYLEDGMGKDVHKYTLINMWPSKVEPSELSYDSSDIATIQATLTYDAAEELGL